MAFLRQLALLIAALSLLPAAAADTKIRVLRDIAYGNDPQQRIDVYVPDPLPKDAPIIAMVHGGAWVFGDKANRQVIANKSEHWVPQGIVFISINNRLQPAAHPVEQGEDVARAIAYIQKEAKSWGADAAKLVMMGHSAGAHLVALVSADPARVVKVGGKPWLGTVVLDSGALDVPGIMHGPHLPLHDRAFGSDPDLWRASSPRHALGKDALPMLAVCSTQRRVSCLQANEFRRAASAVGAKVQVLEMNLNHGEINAKVGEPGDYTRRIDDFIAALDPAFARLK